MILCSNPSHRKYDAGEIEVCYFCHWRTDQTFALQSQDILARAKANAERDEAVKVMNFEHKRAA